MAKWFKRDVAAWMDATESMTDAEYRVYDVILNLIYINDGPIVMHERGFAARCSMHVLKFRAAFDSLISKGKLQLANGKVSNAKAMKVLSGMDRGRTEGGADPTPTPREPPTNPRGVGGGLAGGRGPKQLKLLEPESLSLEREERKERVPFPNGNGHESTADEEHQARPDSGRRGGHVPNLSDPKTAYYARGREILRGGNVGGFLTQLLKAKGDNVALARAALETASTRANPREYLGAIARGATGLQAGRRAEWDPGI